VRPNVVKWDGRKKKSVYVKVHGRRTKITAKQPGEGGSRIANKVSCDPNSPTIGKSQKSRIDIKMEVTGLAPSVRKRGKKGKGKSRST